MPASGRNTSRPGPLNPNSKFSVEIISAPPAAPPQIVFSTFPIEPIAGIRLQLKTPWTVLRDGISGSGGSLMFTDLRT